MAFVTNASGNVIAFSDSFDVRDIEQRVFEANEINFVDAASPAFTSLDEYIDNLCEKSMDRILAKLKVSSWWRTYTGSSINDLPDVNPDRILARKQDFTDMSVYYCLKEYILPKAANFAVEGDAEVTKIQYYSDKFEDMFQELIALADWYDKDGDGSVANDEKLTTFRMTRRTRGKKNIVRVR